ncbi:MULTISPECIES: hypothetical protein [unclassified Carboxylicivirga]|uniref:hypothetical protein n=1 Tax=Carboxylicivirga TaxID=1628153 RepID=UPI003D34C25D
MQSKIIQGAIVNGIINGVINGGIQWFSFKKLEQVAVTMDSITNDQVTVLGSAVPLAVSLAMILTFIAFFSIPKDNRPGIRTKLWVIIKHGFFTFGVVTGMAVLWQYWFGTIWISPAGATLIVGIIAGLVALVVNYLTLEPYSKE